MAAPQRAPSPQLEGSEDSAGLADDCFSSDGETADVENTEKDANDEVVDHEADIECPSAGWADAMAKILNKKTPDSKPIILLKNKKLLQEKEKDEQEKLEKRKQLDKKREWELMCRVKPDVVKDRERERNLQRIATRGVVQLFNAVRTHQSNIDEKVKEAGSSERKRAKLLSSVSKKDFINVLRGKEESKAERSDNRTSKTKKVTMKSEHGPEWNILRDDFMMGASMKDWDKESDDCEGNAEQEHKNAKDDSESDSDR